MHHFSPVLAHSFAMLALLACVLLAPHTQAHAAPTSNPTVEAPMSDTFYIYVGEEALTARFASNSSADALRTLLRQGDITIDAHDYGNFEKVGELGHTLPVNDTHITTEPGDIILYLGRRFVLYYDTNTWDFTRLGKVQGATGASLRRLLGPGNVVLRLSLTPPR